MTIRYNLTFLTSRPEPRLPRSIADTPDSRVPPGRMLSHARWRFGWAPSLLLHALLGVIVLLGVRFPPKQMQLAPPTISVEFAQPEPMAPQPQQPQQEPPEPPPTPEPPPSMPSPTHAFTPPEPAPPKPSPPRPPAPRRNVPTRQAPAPAASHGSQAVAAPGPAPAAIAPPAPVIAPVIASPPVSPGWDSTVSAWIAAHKTYPDAARRSSAQGEITIRFNVAPDGNVLSVEIVRGSGSDILDQSARAMLQGARLPPPLVEVTRAVRLHYKLD